MTLLQRGLGIADTFNGWALWSHPLLGMFCDAACMRLAPHFVSVDGTACSRRASTCLVQQDSPKFLLLWHRTSSETQGYSLVLCSHCQATPKVSPPSEICYDLCSNLRVARGLGGREDGSCNARPGCWLCKPVASGALVCSVSLRLTMASVSTLKFVLQRE